MAYEQFGSPGNLDDQPAEWVDAMMCISSAKEVVKNKIEREQKEKQDKKAKEQRGKARARKRR